ncbi:MAG: lipopolysaccharide heptosyltransferase II [Gammaproteobacteria bacterium]|nr:lipopolysaccharide heptosyltransferase II [Gammaproteobacteria bacterium]
MPTQKLLIIPQNWLGDIVMSQTLLKKIKSNNPKTSIDILVNSSLKNLVERMPEINKVIILDCNHRELGLFKRLRLAKEIKKSSYDRSIVLSRSLKSSLIPYFAKIPIRTGELGELRYLLINDLKEFSKESRRKTASRYISMYSDNNEKLSENYYPSLDSNSENIKNLSEKYDLKKDKKVIIFAPGAAFGPSKMWPVNKFRELGKKLNNDFKILILGSNNEKSIGNDIVTNKNMINLCGKTSIADAVDLMHISKFCVSNDSGLMHLAAATNTKSISIYGSTSPDFTPPLTKNKDIHYKGMSCSPCFEKKCKYGHYNCLVDIHSDDVFKSFK